MSVVKEINVHLKKIERSLGWLSTKTKFNYNTLYSIFVKESMNLSDERLDKINQVLGTNFKNEQP
jgi:hypothetical protein